MKHFLTLAVAALALCGSLGNAFAQDKATPATKPAATLTPAAKPVVAATTPDAKEPTTQQNKMALCNKDAADKKR